MPMFAVPKVFPFASKIFHLTLVLLALFFCAMSLFLLWFGAELLYWGGSPYYVFLGAGLLLSGILILRGKPTGLWVYLLIWGLTILWSLWECGLDGWGYIPRLLGPTLLALLDIFLLLILSGHKKKYKTHAIGPLDTLLFFGLAFLFSGTAWAQIPPSKNVPGPNGGKGQFENLTSFSQKDRYPPPAPGAAQAAGVNAANLPDIGSISVSQLPVAVPQVWDQPAKEDWVVYGGNAQANRYSELDRITPENVKKLQRAFVYHTQSLPPKGKANKWASETTPIKVGSRLYLCSALNDLMAIDATNGKEIWRHKMGVKYESIPYTAACKGVTYFTSSVTPKGKPCHTRILESTLDMRLIAVDTETGHFCEHFGHGGQVNLMQGMGESVPGFVSMTTPPPVIKGVAIINAEILDGQRRWAPSGVIRGYDAESGKFVWAWDVNRPKDHSQPKAGAFYSRGTPNSWAAMTGDDALGQVYVPTGISAVDYFSAMRTPEENAVSSSLVALDARTGKVRWVFQTVHKDVWDYDLGSQATLMDWRGEDDKMVQALILPSKRGQTFILDRRTGKPLKEFPVVERPAPTKNGVLNDERSPTQPWSIGVPRLGKPDLTEKTMWGMSPLDQLMCRLKFRRANYVGEFTPPSLEKPWIEFPGYNGGVDWGSLSYNPETGIVLANWNVLPMYDQLLTRQKANEMALIAFDSEHYRSGSGGAEGNGAQAEAPYGIIVSPFWNAFTHMMCNEPPYGMLTAIDLRAHHVLWQRPLGTMRANGPFGIPTHLPFRIGTPNNGGPVMTKGGVAFIAATTDNLIRAVDMKTGKTLWSDVLPGGGQATPMVYGVNGKQYVAIVAGGHHFMQTKISDQLVVYALPK